MKIFILFGKCNFVPNKDKMRNIYNSLQNNSDLELKNIQFIMRSNQMYNY